MSVVNISSGIVVMSVVDISSGIVVMSVVDLTLIQFAQLFIKATKKSIVINIPLFWFLQAFQYQDCCSVFRKGMIQIQYRVATQMDSILENNQK